MPTGVEGMAQEAAKMRRGSIEEAQRLSRMSRLPAVALSSSVLSYFPAHLLDTRVAAALRPVAYCRPANPESMLSCRVKK